MVNVLSNVYESPWTILLCWLQANEHRALCALHSIASENFVWMDIINFIIIREFCSHFIFSVIALCLRNTICSSNVSGTYNIFRISETRILTRLLCNWWATFENLDRNLCTSEHTYEWLLSRSGILIIVRRQHKRRWLWSCRWFYPRKHGMARTSFMMRMEYNVTEEKKNNM